MPVPLLTSVDCSQQVHLIVGDNGIAAKRVTRSLEAGATCVLITPTDVERLHFDLKNLIERKAMTHARREFQEDDLMTFGRKEVDGVVDMVFVTLSPQDDKGTFSSGFTDGSKLDFISM
jgi:uroporphyrin-III C-methyltransferase